ncbi:MAG TPA: GIY-YIG nuclease family protein, partial [Polyangiaceae bacterium]|nr:GIY-YIG nuclease family protein [Polyangiaceae bacterium]
WKIGFTTATPTERLAGALTFTSEPVTLVAHCAGTKADEQHVHDMLEARRVDLPGRREIFEDCPEVRALVEHVAEFQTTEGFEIAMAKDAASVQLATLERVHGEYQKELREVLGENTTAAREGH